MSAPVHATPPREPLMTRAGVVAAISALSALLVEVGLPQVGGWLGHYAGWIAGAILAVHGVVAAWLARRHVTPVLSAVQTPSGAYVVTTTAPADITARPAAAAGASDIVAQPATDDAAAG